MHARGAQWCSGTTDAIEMERTRVRFPSGAYGLFSQVPDFCPQKREDVSTRRLNLFDARVDVLREMI